MRQISYESKDLIWGDHKPVISHFSICKPSSTNEFAEILPRKGLIRSKRSTSSFEPHLHNQRTGLFSSWFM